MSCSNLTSGLACACDCGMGGIQAIYIAEQDNIVSYTTSTGTITGLTMTTATKFYEYCLDQNRNVATFVETLTNDMANGSSYFLQLLDFRLTKREVSKRNNLALLNCKKLAVIITDNNGESYVMGIDKGARLMSIASPTGAAKGDHNGYNVQIQGEEAVAAYSITAAVIAAHI